MVDSAARGSYADRAKSAALWSVAFNYFRDGLQFVQLIILVRLLDQSAYGLFAFVTSIMGVLSAVSARPFLAQIIQVQREEDVHYQDHFTAAGVLQLAVFLIASLIAFVLARIPAYEESAPLIQVASLIFLLDWGCELRVKMIEREFDFRSLRLLYALGLLLSAGTSVVMALLGFGAYALVVPGMLVTLPFLWDLLVRQGWRPTWEFSWGNYRAAFHFGTTRIGSGMSTRGRTFLESSVLTAVHGFAQLGVLNRAIGLATLACGKIAMQLMTGIYPVLTRLEKESGRVVQVGNLVLRLVTWFIIPVAISLTTMATPLVNTLYGPAWTEVIPFMKWTLAMAVASALVHVAYTLLLARDGTRLCLACDTITLAGTAASLFLMLPFGLVPYLCGIIAVHGLNFLILTKVLIGREAMTLYGIRDAFFPAVTSAMIAGTVAYACLHACQGDLQTKSGAVLWGLIFSAGYLFAIRCLFCKLLLEMMPFLPARRYISRVLWISQT
ncbi:MAG: oligosaccharide flippase family protein [Planctomycetota bacterium]